MGEKESPFNLFSSSGKKNEAKPKNTPVTKKVEQPHSIGEQSQIIEDARTKEMFDQIQEMQTAIKSRLDFIAQKSGMNKEDILKLINTMPGSKPEMEKMNADLKEFAEKVWSTVYKDGKGTYEKKALTAKERKTKTLGIRRNWMRMP